uniref:Myb-binding protein 1A-like protein n=1 Tax=Petromyzon marinus TaxID=7757 RepID=A0AAJ7SK77_PETMA|nr:myb-binding protein 1A-like protein [Petromyzon marinus]
MAMSKLYKLGLLFPFILPLLLLHHLVTCSSHAPLFPLNVRLESRDLLATLCWDPVEAAPSGDGGDRPPLVDPFTINSTTTTTTNSTFLNVTYTVQSKLFRRARWQTVCASTTETRCDVSSALDDPGDRYLLRVRFSFSSSPSRSSRWVAVVVLPLMETVLSAPSFTLRLDKLTRGEDEEEGDGGEDEECGVVGDDEDNDDDGYNDDGDDDDRDGGDDDRHDDGGPGVAGELEAAVDGEPEVRKLSLLVSVGRGWRALVAHDVKYHHQVDISTRGGVRLTVRGCRSCDGGREVVAGDVCG